MFLENDGLLEQNMERHVRPKMTGGFRMKFSSEHIPRPGAGKADLIVDVSEEPEVRRMLAGKEMPRCCAMFLAPRVEAGVLLLEDPLRRLKLDQLEAQCYRSLLHLAAAGGESAADCHDFPAQMPLDAIGPISEALGRRLPGRCAEPWAAIDLCRCAADGRKASIHSVQPHAVLEQCV
ncbi:MAG: hypothetical protein GY859_20500, partial [Desulfobacterales bacterium]|nr:hypothetical protein [Desulfobacterales bacterium]